MTKKKHRDVISVSPNVSDVRINMSEDGVLAVYFRMLDRPVWKTVETEMDDVLVDLDKNGEVIGLELINPQTRSLDSILKKVAKKYKGTSVKRFTAENASRIEKLQELITV